MISRRIFAAVALLCALVAPAQAQKTKAALTAEINANWPDNNVGIITPALLRSTVIDIVNSYYDLGGSTSALCATHQWISSLPTLSTIACTQPAIADISGWGTGVASALGIATNTAGGIVVPTAALTANGVVYGGGSGVTPGSTAAGINGQLFLGVTSGAPQWGTMSGDATISNAGVFTLASVNSNTGSFGSATQCVTVTNNAKGLTTAVSVTTCAPAIGSITGLGTGVATALGVNVGSAGAPVINGGAGGTPSSINLTNATAYPAATNSTLGIVRPDTTTITQSGGILSAVGGVATSIAPLSTTVTGATNGDILGVTTSGCGAGSPCLAQSSFAALLAANPEAILQGSPTTPTGTVSTTGAMMGLGVSTCRFTPVNSTRAEFNIQGSVNSSVATAGATVSLRFADAAVTAAPTNPSGTTSPVGTQIALPQAITSSTGGAFGVFNLSAIVSSLILGHTYWIDLDAVSSSGASGVNFSNITCNGKGVY